MRTWPLALLLLQILTLPRAWASQEATVVSGETSLYEQNHGKFQAILRLKIGQRLRVADHPKSGWYACAIPGSRPAKAGWVRASEISLPQGGLNGKTATQLDETRSRWDFSALYDAVAASPSALQNSVGLASGLSIGSSFGLEMDHPVSDRLQLGLRIDILFLSGKIVGGNPGGGDLSYSGLATPVVLLAHYDLLHRRTFRIGLVGGLGLSPVTNFNVAVGDETSNGSAMALAIPIAIEADIRVSTDFSILIEGGYRRIQPFSSVPVANGFNLGNDFSSTLIGAGLRYSFQL